MTHAYDEKYLDDAMRNMGEMTDYITEYGMDLDVFWDMFIATGFAGQFENGVPRVVCGLSGTELAWAILEKSGFNFDFPEPQREFSCSDAYWSGWIIAYYQWYTGQRFKDIRKIISMNDVLKMYPALHEAPEKKFVDVVESRIERQEFPTRLSIYRRINGYSQRILAEKSGIHLRNIQQYEQRQKDINKAAAVTVLSLSRALGCGMEDLMEYEKN